jgi:acyl dehydratase
MTFDQAMIGRRCGEHVVTIDRATVSNFATVLDDASPVYQDARAARAAGFTDVPAPPTYPFVMLHWGNRPELLDEYAVAPVPASPLSGMADQLGHIGVVVAELMAECGPGVVLHAGQEFEYHRPIVAGDVLRGENTIVDVFLRRSGDATLTFVVIESAWRDARSGTPVVTTRFTAVHRPSPPSSAPVSNTVSS